MKVEFSHDEIRYCPEENLKDAITLVKAVQIELVKHIRVRK